MAETAKNEVNSLHTRDKVAFRTIKSVERQQIMKIGTIINQSSFIYSLLHYLSMKATHTSLYIASYGDILTFRTYGDILVTLY